ncbi:MAG: hemerythrin domain-containing protein [Elusimicrobia bacterium]|nr:hemerythrin domain-containing protein [Elusimicrobiota bacterium]
MPGSNDRARARPSSPEEALEFLTGLSRHIVWEEEVLFPLFEEKTGMTGGPTQVMRTEHRWIKDRLDAVHEKVRAADPGSDGEVEALLAVLGQHNMKEENILYPAIDAQLDAEGVAAVKKAMDSVPEERYACCCQAHAH